MNYKLLVVQVIYHIAIVLSLNTTDKRSTLNTVKRANLGQF